MCIRDRAGPDGWLPAELRLLPIEAFDLLASLFNAVEAGARWPKELLVARAVALPKTKEVQLTDALKYRLLMTTPTVYRLWARAGLKDLQSWQESWADPCMHAGFAGRGADDA
eukprot:7552849-Alexandrium_andersonii.AAC.1